MTGDVIWVAVLTVVIAAWAAVRWRDRRREARDKAAARAAAVRRHPSRVPGLPRDGEPLDESPGGEAEQLAALEYAYRHVSIPEPGNPPRQEQGK